MRRLAALCGACLALLAAGQEDEPLVARSIVLEHAFGGGPFSRRCTLRAELMPAAAAAAATATAAPAGAAPAPRWRLRPEDNDKGGVEPGDVAAATAAALGGGLYRLRARSMDGGEAAPFALISIKMCLLASAAFRHDVFLSLDAAGALRSVDVRAAVPAGFAGCQGSTGVPAAALTVALPAEGVTFSAARFGVAPVEEAAPVPVVNAGRGVPYPGQPELKDADAARISAAVAAAAAAASGGDADAGGAAAEAEAALLSADGQRDGPPPQSLLQQYLPYMLGLYVVFTIGSRFFTEEEKEPAGSEAGGGAGTGPAHAARQAN